MQTEINATNLLTGLAILAVASVLFVYLLCATDAGRACSAISGDADHYWACQASRLDGF